MAYLVDFYTQYSTKINNANFSDPAVAAAMKVDPMPSTFTTGVTSYISPLLEFIILAFYNDANAFFEMVKKIVYSVSICFVLIFLTVYLTIFVRFIGSLHEEIKQTHEIVNMIPMFVLEGNQKVREQVWNHKGMN